MNLNPQISSPSDTIDRLDPAPWTFDFTASFETRSGGTMMPPQTRELKSPVCEIKLDLLNHQIGAPVIDLELRPSKRFPIRVRMPTEVMLFGCVRDGALGMVLPDLGRQSFKAGDWFILRTSEFTAFTSEPVSLFAFAVTREMLNKMASLAAPGECAVLRCFTCPKLQEPTLVRQAGNDRLHWLAQQIRSNRASTGLDPRLTWEIHCLEWLRELFRQPELANRRMCVAECSEREKETLQEIADYLGAHLDADHTLADLSRRFALNQFKLKRGFKAAFGVTVFTYLRDLRIQRAALLLREENASVLEIANAVGYSNPSHFARNFKEKIGLLPKTYQQLHRGTSRPASL